MLQKSYFLPTAVILLSVVTPSFSLPGFASTPSVDNLYAARAKNFTVGAVKYSHQAGAVCVVMLPKTKKIMLLIPFPEKDNPTIGWVNINGQDIQITQVSHKKKSKNRFMSVYKSKNIVIVIESVETKPADETAAVPVLETSDKVSITYGGRTKVINTTGYCAS